MPIDFKRKKKKQFLNANENNHENVEYKLVLFEGKEGTFTGMFTVIYIYVHTHIYICVCVCVCVWDTKTNSYCFLLAELYTTLLWPPWTLACMDPPSTGFPKQDYWSGLPFPSPWDLPNLGIEPVSISCFHKQALYHWATWEASKTISVQFSRSVVSNSLWPHELQHARPPVHHQLQFTQTHVHRVGDAIQPSHPLSSASPPASNPSEQQSLFQWVNSSHEVAKVLEFQLQHHSFQETPRADLHQNGLVVSLGRYIPKKLKTYI